MKILKLALSFLGVILLGNGCTIIENRSETTYSGTQVSDVTMAQLEIGKTAASDYRPVWPHCFKLIGLQEKGPQWFFILQKK